jgi:hypothetical protein
MTHFLASQYSSRFLSCFDRLIHHFIDLFSRHISACPGFSGVSYNLYPESDRFFSFGKISSLIDIKDLHAFDFGNIPHCVQYISEILIAIDDETQVSGEDLIL